MQKQQTLVLVTWEHPSRGGGVHHQTRVMLGEGQSAATVIAGAEGLSDRVIVHRVTAIEEGGV